MKKIYALGIGHNTPVCIDLAISCGYEIAGLYHYNSDITGQKNHGYTVLGSFDDLFSIDSLEGMNFLLTMGDNKIKYDLAKRIISKGGDVPTLIHPTCIISRFAKISTKGVYIWQFTSVEADSYIGDMTTLLSNIIISHTTKIGKGCFIAGGSIIGAYTDVEDFVFVGQGTLSISAKVRNIGTHAYIGARALLTHNIPSYSVVAGSPARIIRKIKN